VVVKSNSPLHQPGDRVFGIIPVPLQFPSKQGALAQYARLPGSNIVKRPDDMSAVDAAGFALAGETAYVGLFEVCKLEPGQMVFVNGGSSSVGAYAIQLAKAKGLTVWASASGKNEDFVRGLGADKVYLTLCLHIVSSLIRPQFFDYTQQPLHEAIAADASQPRFHAILDAVGLVDPRLFMMSPAFTTPDAIYAHVGPPTPASLSDGVALVRWVWQGLLCPTALGGTRRKMKIVALQHTAARLQEIGRLVQEGTRSHTPVADFGDQHLFRQSPPHRGFCVCV
jgi:NADPH:quinone reductase-like Zn-dependent oxidoreductase